MGRVLKINRMGDKKLALIIIIYNKIYSKIFIQSKYLFTIIKQNSEISKKNKKFEIFSKIF